MQEIRLYQNKNYKGCIRWFKLKIGNGVFKVEKRRPYGYQSYRITPEEFEWITDCKKAEAMWAYYHYYGTASYYGGDIKHPITGLSYLDYMKLEQPMKGSS